jgi:hypothetical protein
MSNVLLAALLLGLPQEKPLPERSSFLIEFQVKRPGLWKAFGDFTDSRLARQYTYVERVTETTLDSKGNAKGSKANVFEVIPTRIDGFTYRRQIIKDGKPLTQKELDKQDSKQEEEIGKVERERAKAMARSAKAKPNPAPTPPRPAPRIEDSEILNAADFQLLRRESIDGHPVILLSFKPNLAYKPRGDIAKMLQHATGHVWVSESDYELVKLEAQVIDTISFGMGILGRVQPGSRGAFEWRKINDEIWLPLREDFTAKARILLVKGMHMREVHEYSEHKKYSVNTEVQFQAPVEK